jgi:hypothetical protein
LIGVAERNREGIRRAVRAAISAGGVVAVGALAGLFTLKHTNLALILSGLILATSFLLLKDARENIFGTDRWIPYAWVALCLAPDHRFTFHSTLDNSVSSATPENFVQVATYMLVAALVLHSRRLKIERDPRHLHTGPLLVWPVIALVSTIWSLVPLFTFVRALQLFVPIGLALLMARIWLTSPDAAVEIWVKTLRLFVRTVTILVLVGFATGFWGESRFTWPGAHPGTAAMYIGMALLILLAGGRSLLDLRASGYVFRVALFGTALYLGKTRGVEAAMILALAVMFWWAARTKPLKSYLGVFYYAITVSLVLVAFLPEIARYVLRGGTTGNLMSLSGRIPLWTDALHLLGDGPRWFIGFGYGSARVLLPALASWAGTAHNSWLELLLAIGILGPLLLATDVVFILWRASSRASLVAPSLTLSILTLLVVSSISGEGLALPSLSLVMFVFLHAPVLAELNSAGHPLRTRGGAAPGNAIASRVHRPLAASTRGDHPVL